MGEIKIDSVDLKSQNKFDLSTKSSRISNYDFWHYTSLYAVNEILKGKEFRISNINGMNDNEEKRIHEDNLNNTFCLCFCNSNTEKIPLWYLYSGISGRGAAIGLTPATMTSLISSVDCIKAYKDKNCKDNDILEKGKDFDIEYGWVYYRKGKRKSQILYKMKWYSLNDCKNFEKDNYFIKSYPWEYEKEFRIIIHNKTSKRYEKLGINIENIYEKLKLKLAPELSSEDGLSLIEQYEEIKNFSLKKPLIKSDLDIKMDLCKRNYDSFLDYIKLTLHDKEKIEECKIDVGKICEIIKIENYCKKEK